MISLAVSGICTFKVLTRAWSARGTMSFITGGSKDSAISSAATSPDMLVSSGIDGKSGRASVSGLSELLIRSSAANPLTRPLVELSYAPLHICRESAQFLKYWMQAHM